MIAGPWLYLTALFASLIAAPTGREPRLAGWVEVDGGAIEAGECVVRLKPWVPGRLDPTAAARAEQATREAAVSRDGFFQLKGLPPGVYALEAVQPGFAPVRIAPLRVDLQTETFLPEPLVLRRPLALSIEVSPPLDWLGKPWQAQVVRLEEAGGKPTPFIFEGRVGESGRLTVPDQSAGLFRVSLQDSLGNRLASSDISLSSPDSPPQAIEVDLVTVNGSVWLGQEPLAATLWFGGRSGMLRVRLDSDSDGLFHGILPKGGDWKVDVDAAEPRLRMASRVDVRADRSGKASVDIRLPDTRLFGKVVDEQGKAVPDATVLLLTDSLETFELSDAIGGFELRGAPEGQAWLAASKGTRGSARTIVDLLDGRAVGPIELRLVPVRRLSGTVRSATGPVSGAQIAVVATEPAPGGGFAVSEADGSFEVEVPQATLRVTATVAAPGYALRAFDISADAPMSFLVSEEQGDLEIRLDFPDQELIRSNQKVAIFQNGQELLANLLQAWSRQQGAPWPTGTTGTAVVRIPGLAPGDYRVCLVPLRLPLEGGPPAQAECDSGLLFAGGALTLSLGEAD